MNQAAVSVKQRQRPDSSRGLFVHIMVRTVGRPCCSTPLLREKKMAPSLSLGPSAAAVPIDIPDSWDPRTKQQRRVALADFSAAPWQGFEKSERGPNSSSLFQPQAAVVAVAVQVLLSAEEDSRKALCEYRLNQRGTGDSPAAAVLLLDIPRGWKPRAKQQPTGLIACGAAHRLTGCVY